MAQVLGNVQQIDSDSTVCVAVDEPGEAGEDGRVRQDRRQGLSQEVGWGMLLLLSFAHTCMRRCTS